MMSSGERSVMSAMVAGEVGWNSGWTGKGF